MTKADQLTTLLSFLLLAYLALTAAGAFAFTFMTRGALPLYRQACGSFPETSFAAVTDVGVLLRRQ
jgi:hypothetical protein